MQFDHIPYEDLKGDWHKLGSGSFGNVYKGSYLGTDVAIKEVLPSNDYDVRKYFEREWKLMREARHPNVVLFLGLSSAPDGRVFIVSEYIENGNLRQYIFARSKPFPWRLRLSFCIDIARALAYLHARNCVHRDIKGENLLLTSNGRLKITDFGFARITPRSPEEVKRLTYCGTDAYMSPEILVGDPFDLPTDVFSLGIIYCEIVCRRVADDHTFKRAAPMYSLDATELHRLASPGCPPDLVQLALDCCSVFPANRPNMVQVLARLSEIEAQVLQREDSDQDPVGTVRFFTAGAGVGSRRPRVAPRIPSFGMGVGAEIRASSFHVEIPASVSPVDVPASPPSDYGDEPEPDAEGEPEPEEGDSEDQADVILVPEATLKRTPSWAAYGSAMAGRSSMLGDRSGWSQAEMIPSEPNSVANLLAHAAEATVASDAPPAEHESTEGEAGEHPDTTSVLTVRASHYTLRISPIATIGPSAANGAPETERKYVSAGVQSPTPPEPGSPLSAGSFHTAPIQSSASVLSQASSRVLIHRFTLIKPAKPPTSPPAAAGSSWSPVGFFFNIGLGKGSSAKCDLCGRRVGWKVALECDDCGMRCHVKCGEGAPNDCGVRFPRVAPAVPLGQAAGSPAPTAAGPTPAAGTAPEVSPPPTASRPLSGLFSGGARSPPGSPGRWRKSPKLAVLGL
ncbi:kinase-like protein [Calocera cornea HHB12733]|uniref:Kinase-like protein n=1 Tax=Calocera cornea HHB12733 TaxID=1353952 RepID=A0A165J5Y4_9BASI|nr:kinase-like protein [Calocera cornea HHB12733]